MEYEQGQRIPHLDLMRGIAVLGLLLMNLPSMGLLEVGYVQHAPALLADNVMVAAEAFLFDGRFRSLFCILFGIGLYLQWQKYQQAGLNSYKVLKSRMWWLLLFGIIHGVFIWAGDILAIYALSGFYLIGRINYDADKDLKRGVILFSIGIVLMLLLAVASFMEPALIRGTDIYEEEVASIYSPYSDYITFNATIVFASILTYPLLLLFTIAGPMLIGLGLFKSGQLTKGLSPSLVTKFWIVTLVFSSLDVGLAWSMPEYSAVFGGILGSVSGLTMALLIWHYIVKNDVANSANVLVTGLKSAGTIAFTLYILQSVVMTTLFHWVYPEWTLTFTLLDYFLVSVAFIIIQVAFAVAYKSMFKQGPLEYIWRKQVERRLKKEQRRAAESAAMVQPQPASAE